MTSIITISENIGTFELHFELEGTFRVPISIELNFREGEKIAGVKNFGDGINFLNGKGSYSLGKNIFTSENLSRRMNGHNLVEPFQS